MCSIAEHALEVELVELCTDCVPQCVTLQIQAQQAQPEKPTGGFLPLLSTLPWRSIMHVNVCMPA
jgi:hypothetical protein